MNEPPAVTIAGLAWTPRPFSASEHQRWSELATTHKLDELAADVEAASGIGGGTTREKLLNADINQHREQLAAYLTEDGSAPRPDLTDAERLAAYELAATIDDLTLRADTIKSERVARALVLQNRHAEALQAAIITFAHDILSRDGVPVPDLDVFARNVTDVDLATLERVVSEGKLSGGLSALTRRDRAMLHELRRLHETQQSGSGTGSDSESTPPRQASPGKSGKPVRSRKSSSRSKQAS